MGYLHAIVILVILAIIAIPLLPLKTKALAALLTIIASAVLSSILALSAISGFPVEFILKGSFVTGPIPFRMDALSAWFILTINFTFLTGVFYGRGYMKAYTDNPKGISMHWIAYILTHAALIGVCSVQNSLVFLIFWEIMALSAFIMVIFEGHKQQTLKAGINYLIQSHICIIFLSLALIWVIFKTHSLDFNAIGDFFATEEPIGKLVLFFCLFIGFAIKAGFVPFHTWLPHAHPAAPSHVSGVMSGVIIKIGIYGILRMLTYVQTDYSMIGFIILIVSVFTGVYGVMLAIIQHNLKRLLAYHSIENIGIIGIGIGVGCIGLGSGNRELMFFGFAGALLHTLNHSLFKSLLFYGAGNIYQSTHTINIEQLGGIGKKMPHTSFLFLIAALAICGLPPFNGFVSEYIIYNGLFNGLGGADFPHLMLIISTVFGLALIGGLAILCFTKAFGTIFLGTARHNLHHQIEEASFSKLAPMYAIVMIILSIGIFPKVFVDFLTPAVNVMTSAYVDNISIAYVPDLKILTSVGYASLAFLIISAVVFFIRNTLVQSKPQNIEPTWGCGYVGSPAKIQYTASSFVRNFRKLAEPVLSIHKYKKEVEGIFPGKAWHETHPHDKAEEFFVDKPIKWLKLFLNRFSFLQQGNPQMYVLYGFAFIILIIGVPEVYDLVLTFVKFLYNL
jgi:hydrogenase-4 component B